MFNSETNLNNEIQTIAEKKRKQFLPSVCKNFFMIFIE